MPHQFGIGDTPSGGMRSAYDRIQNAVNPTKQYAHTIDISDS